MCVFVMCGFVMTDVCVCVCGGVGCRLTPVHEGNVVIFDAKSPGLGSDEVLVPGAVRLQMVVIVQPLL